MELLSLLSELVYTFDVDINQYHKCWSVGSNKNGQQANKYNTNDNKELRLMNKLPHNLYIDDIISGCWGSTYILCNDNSSLIVFGCNASGQLSIDYQIIRIIIKNWTKQIRSNILITLDISKLIENFIKKHCSNFGSLTTPIIMDEFNIINLKYNKILFISQGLGSHHKFIVTQDVLTTKDHLFGVGRNDHNQLGASDKKNRNDFKEIKYFNNISAELAQIHCARDYTHFLSEKGQLFESSERSIAIKPIKSIANRIIDVCCGYEHTLAITEHNRIYSWGDNLYGQLGHGQNKSRVTEPKMIRYLLKNKITNVLISAGQYHSAIVSTSGQLYVFGWNEFYQCGNGRDQNIYLPALNTTLINKCIKQIKCGFNHNVAITQNDEYYLWGHNRYNQCMVYDDDIKYVTIPTKWEYEADIGIFSKILAIYPGWCETRVVTT